METAHVNHRCGMHASAWLPVALFSFPAPIVQKHERITQQLATDCPVFAAFCPSDFLTVSFAA